MAIPLSRVCFALGLLLLPLVSTAEEVYQVTGVVRGTLLDGRLVIEHEAIPGFMPAMTMPFNVPDPELVAKLQDGDQVQFLFHLDGKSSFADNFQVTGKEISRLAQVLSDGVKPLQVGDPVPSFQLVDEKGAPISEMSLGGHATLITFIFTRCPVPEFCPLLATRFLEIQSQVKEGEDQAGSLRLLSITLDPEFDTPEILLSYAKRVGADPDLWGFATGEGDEVRKLARAFDVMSNGSGVTLNHSLNTALIGPDRRLVKLWPGNRWTADQVMAEIASVLPSEACCSEACCEE